MFCGHYDIPLHSMVRLWFGIFALSIERQRKHSRHNHGISCRLRSTLPVQHRVASKMFVVTTEQLCTLLYLYASF